MNDRFSLLSKLIIKTTNLRQTRSQPVFSGKPRMISRDNFVRPVPSFSEMKEIG